MEIEKLIDELRIAGAGNPGNIFDEAANVLERLNNFNESQCAMLLKKNAYLHTELEQLKRERDAAIEDIFNFSSNKCFCCAHNTHKWLSDGGMDDLCKTCLENGKCNWVWRGVQKEDR